MDVDTLAASLNATALKLARAEDSILLLRQGADAQWLLITGMGILLMQVGFSALEIGATRAKHVKATLLKNLLDQSVASVCWMFVGWGIFKESHITFLEHPEAEYPQMLQQFRFAATSVTIVSGAVLTRCKLEVYVLFAAITCGLTYPFLGHVIWHGTLRDMGVEDFAGGMVVHTFGGTCALVGAWLCGPRVGRKRDGGGGAGGSSSQLPLPPTIVEDRHAYHSWFHPLRLFTSLTRACRNCCLRFTLQQRVTFKPQPGHSSSFAVTGVLLLYVSWFSFNSGSSGGMTTSTQIASAGRAAINTSVSAGASATVGFLYSKYLLRKQDVNFLSNSVLAGLVIVTAGCGYMPPYLGCIVGILSVPLYHFCSWMVGNVFLIDDPLDAAAVHLGCGAMGSLWVGLADMRTGAFFGHGGDQLRLQAIGVSVAIAWGVATSLTIFGIFAAVGMLVYDEDAQVAGLDYIYFGGYAFPDYDGSIAGEKLDDDTVRQYHVTKRLEDARRAQERDKRSSTGRTSMIRLPSIRMGGGGSGQSSPAPSRRGSKETPSTTATPTNRSAHSKNPARISKGGAGISEGSLKAGMEFFKDQDQSVSEESETVQGGGGGFGAPPLGVSVDEESPPSAVAAVAAGEETGMMRGNRVMSST